MIRTVYRFAAAGVLVPIILIAIRSLELHIDPQAIPYSSLYGFYLWPSWIMMMAADRADSLTIAVILSVSILANVLLYVIIGLAVGGMWKLLLKLRGVRGSLPAR